jgi:GNAT superfamily N-acetyltransferase
VDPGRESAADRREGSGRPVDGTDGRPVDPPTPLEATARDGTALVIGPLLARDRQELARGYEQLSEESRRRRFFSPPSRLSDAQLDYLTELDFDQHFALAARLRDGPGQPGLGVGRWIRDPDDRTKAEAAVTVADRWQGRGIGTELLKALVQSAAERGVTTFTADVLWENTTLLDTLRQLGARVRASEPGLARVEFDLPAPGADLAGTAMHRLLVVSAAEGGGGEDVPTA